MPEFMLSRPLTNLVPLAAAVLWLFWHQRRRVKYVFDSDASFPRYVLFNRNQSNNCARIRAWVYLRGVEAHFDIRETSHQDQRSAKYAALNPQKKIPLLVRLNTVGGGEATGSGCGDGDDSGGAFSLHESAVILEFLEEAHGGGPARGAALMPASAEGRAHVRLVIRSHDLYLASPSSNQLTPTGINVHNMGAMFIAPPPKESGAGAGTARALDKPTRASKLASVWEELDVLEGLCRGPFFAGEELSLADLTVAPTFVYFTFYLPLVFGWEEGPFHGRPKLRAWHAAISAVPAVARVMAEAQVVLDKLVGSANLDAIMEETRDIKFKWRYP